MTCLASPASEGRLLDALLAARGLPSTATAAGLGSDRVAPDDLRCDVLAWAGTGEMWLTGHRSQAPIACRAPIAARLEAVAGLFESTTAVGGAGAGRTSGIDLPSLLSGRAAAALLERRGRVSPGGSCRLIRSADGWIAVNMARPEDLASVPALTGTDVPAEPGAAWSAVGRVAAVTPGADLVELAQLLGIAASSLGAVLGPPVSVVHLGEPAGLGRRSPRVIDLSSMWAGPLCAQLLARAGASVTKVESTGRPDGARSGPPLFYDHLNAGKASVEIDFTTPEGVGLLRSLIDRADVVIESSRPRALRQLGIGAEAFVSSRPGRTWLSITGYGRTGSLADRVAFGDDAAVAGGLVGYDGEDLPVFCGDALADPATGLFAALAVARSHALGGGQLLDVALSGVAAYLATSPGPVPSHSTLAVDEDRWMVMHDDARADVRSPVLPPAAPAAAMTGADTARVLQDLAVEHDR